MVVDHYHYWWYLVHCCMDRRNLVMYESEERMGAQN